MFRKPAPPTQQATKVSITDSAPCEKSLTLQVGMELIAPIRAAVLAEVQKDAALPGFRKGKAPTNLIERQYAKTIYDETLQRAIRHALEQAAKDHGLKPVGPFEVKSVDFSESSGLNLEATVEVEPAFKLASYKGISLTRAVEVISPQDVDQAVVKLQESMAQLVPAKEGQAKERQVPPLDDELAKDLGFENLATMRSHVEAKLREQKRFADEQALEGALCDELIKRHAFDVPAKLVGHQTERLKRDFTVRLMLSGMPEEQVTEHVAKYAESLRQAGERHVKLAFILDRIAEQESMGIAQDELVGRLWQLARRWKNDPAEVRKILDAQGLWPSVVSALRQEKTIRLVLSSASINGSAGTTPSSQ